MQNHTYPTLTHLGDITISEFLTQYWQKKPLLIRNAFPNFEPLIRADELAGLSLESDVNSRLVIQKKHDDWQVEHGPLAEERFANLSEKNWTLLVQHVDSLVPEVNALLNAFRFIPNWRLDDIMVSYATDNGGVGPHFDYFDVFLLQGEGKRRWRIGQTCDGHSKLIPNQPMKILTDFETTEDWITEPGDLLYIPAQTAHWGEAVGESITYSIGFRAPSDAEILLDYSQEASIPLTDDHRYKDPDLTEQNNSGEISNSAIHKIMTTLQKYATDEDAITRWLGEYSTQLKYTSDNIELPLDILTLDEFQQGELGQLSPLARSAYIPNKARTHTQTSDAEAYCFINGICYTCSLMLAEKLCQSRSITWEALSTSDASFITRLLHENLIIYSE